MLSLGGRHSVIRCSKPSTAGLSPILTTAYNPVSKGRVFCSLVCLFVNLFFLTFSACVVTTTQKSQAYLKQMGLTGTKLHLQLRVPLPLRFTPVVLHTPCSGYCPLPVSQLRVLSHSCTPPSLAFIHTLLLGTSHFPKPFLNAP